jgi:serine/threonine-protein kinase
MSQEFSPNTLVGAYRIEERVGAGGMGVVYRATDTKLGRQVALKVIRGELLHDVALARFQREARVLASLNHPGIAAIHALEESGGVQFLVLEYVVGPTLADRLRRGPLPIREAVIMAKQIAEALETAHAQGVIHRDLKPANLKLSDNGQVKVLDFGLAKPVSRLQAGPATDSTVTVTEKVTEPLTIVGTAAYMSPEQACGKELDARTDIWSFGCVLYEMLSGKQPFRGSTITEILAAVVEREPDWAALPPGISPAVERLLRRCLRKDPASRLRDIGDGRMEIEDDLAAPTAGTPREAGVTRRTAIGALAGTAIGAAATGFFAISRFRKGVPRNLTRFSIGIPGGGGFSPSFNRRIAISPDGKHVAFCPLGLPNALTSAPNVLYLRSLGELESKLLKDAGNGSSPFFSPDSQWLVFFNAGGGIRLRKMPINGGPPATIASLTNFVGAAWTPNNQIYLVIDMPSGLSSLPAAGGTPQEILKIDFAKGERSYRYPCALPDTNIVLVTVSTTESETFDDARIVAFSPDTREKKTLVEGGTHPRYSPSGHVLYARDGKIFALRFDPKTLKISGQPFLVVDGLLMSRNSGLANFDVSATGDLAYIPGACETGARTLVWVDRDGKAEAVSSLPPRAFLHPRLSPDARRLAIEIEGPNHNLFVYDFERAVLATLTTDGVSHWPVWSPDGTELAFRAGPMAAFRMWRVPADRSRDPQQVAATGVSQSAESWSPDGRALVYTHGAPGVAANIVVAALEGDHATHPLEVTKFAEGSPKFSPDGRWLAYCSNESGKPQVYVQAYPGPGAKIQISSDGGTDPVWRRTGGELFYRNGDSMMAVALTTASAFQAGRPQELWRGHYSHGMSSSCGLPGPTSSNYDVTADGRRFLMIKDDSDTIFSKESVVVQGLAEELERLAAKA